MPDAIIVENGTTVETPPAAVTTQPAAIDWQAHIPADYAKDKAWEPLRNKDLPDVLKGYAEAQKLVSSSVRLPKPGEDVAKWKADNLPKLAAAGIVSSAPATPADYKFERPEAALDVGWDDKAEARMREVWHKAGLSNEQVQATVAAYAAIQGERFQTAERYFQESQAALKQEWGAEYEARLGRAVRFIKETGAEYGIEELFGVSGFGNNPNVVKWVASLAQSAVEHGAMTSTGQPGVTAEDFARRTRELRDEMGKTNAGSSRMQELQAELDALYQRHTPR